MTSDENLPPPDDVIAKPECYGAEALNLRRESRPLAVEYGSSRQESAHGHPASAYGLNSRLR